MKLIPHLLLPLIELFELRTQPAFISVLIEAADIATEEEADSNARIPMTPRNLLSYSPPVVSEMASLSIARHAGRYYEKCLVIDLEFTLTASPTLVRGNRVPSYWPP